MMTYACPICQDPLGRDISTFMEHTNTHIVHAKVQHIEAVHQRALKQFSTAFGLMSIIPLLICIYLVSVRFYSVDILVGINGAYFLIAIMITLLGLLFGRSIINALVHRLSTTSMEWVRLTAEEASLTTQRAATPQSDRAPAQS